MARIGDDLVGGVRPRQYLSPLAQATEFRRIPEQPRDRRTEALRVFDPIADPLPFDPVARSSFVAGKGTDGEQRQAAAKGFHQRAGAWHV